MYYLCKFNEHFCPLYTYFIQGIVRPKLALHSELIDKKNYKLKAKLLLSWVKTFYPNYPNKLICQRNFILSMVKRK